MTLADLSKRELLWLAQVVAELRRNGTKQNPQRAGSTEGKKP